MGKIKNGWTRLKCLLIGFDYDLLSSCTIQSKKLLTKYFSAIFIIIIIWFFIGFQMVREYIDPDNISLSIVFGLVFVTIIVMVERQIILSSSVSLGQLIFRTGLGLVMAVLGATIIDSALFKNDIEIKKQLYNKDEINQRYSLRTDELEKDIIKHEKEKEEEIIKLEYIENRIASRGNKIQAITKSYKTEIVRDAFGNPKLDSLGRPITQRLDDIQSSLTDNPEIATAISKREIIAKLTRKIDSISVKKNDLKEIIIKEVNEEKGIIRDLVILKDLLLEERVGMLFYIFWFIFFLMIEMLVLVSKYSERNNTCDYYEKIKYQEEISALKLKRLLKNSMVE